MNKYFIVFLAVCLVSVHGFAKRDAPAPAANNDLSFDTLKKQAEEFLGNFGKQLENAVSSDNIKAQFDTLKNNINDIAKKFETTETPKQ